MASKSGQNTDSCLQTSRAVRDQLACFEAILQGRHHHSLKTQHKPHIATTPPVSWDGNPLVGASPGSSLTWQLAHALGDTRLGAS